MNRKLRKAVIGILIATMLTASSSVARTGTSVSSGCTIAPSVGSPGSTIIVRGTNLTAKKSGKVWLDLNRNGKSDWGEPSQAVHTDAGGQYQTTITVPLTAAFGQFDIITEITDWAKVLNRTTARYAVQCPAHLKLALRRENGDTLITVSGTGFPPKAINGRVWLDFNGNNRWDSSLVSKEPCVDGAWTDATGSMGTVTIRVPKGTKAKTYNLVADTPGGGGLEGLTWVNILPIDATLQYGNSKEFFDTHPRTRLISDIVGGPGYTFNDPVGLLIDSYEQKQTATGYDVSLNVFNASWSPAALEVLDASHQVVRTEFVADSVPASGIVESAFKGAGQAWDSFAGSYQVLDFRNPISVTRTALTVHVPPGGAIRISHTSKQALAYAYLMMLFQATDFTDISLFKQLSTEKEFWNSFCLSIIPLLGNRVLTKTEEDFTLDDFVTLWPSIVTSFKLAVEAITEKKVRELLKKQVETKLEKKMLEAGLKQLNLITSALSWQKALTSVGDVWERASFLLTHMKHPDALWLDPQAPTEKRFTITQVLGWVVQGVGIEAIEAGGNCSFAIKEDGSLWAWGANSLGELGDGTWDKKNTPEKILGKVMAISSPGDTSLAIQEDGSLWAWGYNSHGQLGDGTQINQNTPRKIADRVKTVSAGLSHSLALKEDGSLWAWGYNFYGELGDGTHVNRSTPVKVTDKIKAMAAGGNHSLVIKEDGSLWAWGSNRNGQLGNGSDMNSDTPVKVMDHVKAVSTTFDACLAIKEDGSLWAWGSSTFGVLGDGTHENRNRPVKIMDRVKSISTAGFHSLALKEDGSLWAWGYNFYGQLGDGTKTERDTPVKIMDRVKAISAGGYHSLAIKTDGSLWAWGWNPSGQLGDGTYEGKTIPTKVTSR